MAAPVRVCIDSCVYMALLMPDEDVPGVNELWAAWRGGGTEICAPTLFVWECLNVLRRAVISNRVAEVRAPALASGIMGAPVALMHFEDRADEVWSRFVIEYDLPTVYDALYLAVADDLSCELWAEDHRLYRAVRDRLPWVRCSSLEA